MPPKTNFNNCETGHLHVHERSTDNSTCGSPMCLVDRETTEAIITTKMNGLIGLCVVAVGLLSYSVFWQAPSIRTDIAREINRLDTQDTKLRTDLDNIGLRVSTLENSVGRKVPEGR